MTVVYASFGERGQEFDCADCGRHIVRMIPAPPPLLCGECIHIPGWFNNPELRAMLDPGHRVPEDKP